MENKRHKYTEEENEFIRKSHEGLTGKELTDLFNLKFGCDISKRALMHHKTTTLRLKLKKRIPWNKGLKGWQKAKPKHLFKKGHLPKRTKPIGSEKIDGYGFIKIKVDNLNSWRLKHHVIYEKYHNLKIGKRDKVIFLDGNKRNFDINNLEKISNSEQLYLSSAKLLGDNSELNKAAIVLSKLVNKTKFFEKGKI